MATVNVAAKPKVSRRKLIIGASAGAAAVGMLVGIPIGDAIATHSSNVAIPTSTGPLMAYVTDPTTAEFVLLVGTQKYTFRDPDLVQRLLRAAH